VTDTGSEPGTQKFGTYRLLRRIAVGGMAEIYLAVARGIGGFEKRLVLKMIHPKYSENEMFIRMLIEEAKLSVQLTHQNVAQVFDLGRIDGTYFIAMEFVEGCDLFHLLKTLADRGDRLAASAAAFVCHEVATGLDYAHSKNDHAGHPLGIVHRDVSPQNVLLSLEGDVKIVDFGIAKARSRMQQTEAGVIKGKYYYMSPEQAKGGDLDPRTDVYSLGIVLWEMLAGRMCFLEDNHMVLMDRVRRADVPPITRVRPDVNPNLAAIAMTAVRPNPDERYQTAGEMAAELGEYLLDAGDFNRIDLVRVVGSVVGNTEDDEEDTTTEDFPSARFEDLASRSESSLLFRLSEVAQAVERIAPAKATAAAAAAKKARLGAGGAPGPADLPILDGASGAEVGEPVEGDVDLDETISGKLVRDARRTDRVGGADASGTDDEPTPFPESAMLGAVPQLDDRPDEDATVVDQQAVASALVEVRRQQAEILGFQPVGGAPREDAAKYEWPPKGPPADAPAPPAPSAAAAVIATVRAGSGPKPAPAPGRRALLASAEAAGTPGATLSPLAGAIPSLAGGGGSTNTEDIPTSTFDPGVLDVRAGAADADPSYDFEHATWVQEPHAGADAARATIQAVPAGAPPPAPGAAPPSAPPAYPAPAPMPAHLPAGVVDPAPGPSALKTALIAMLLAVLVAGALAAGFFAMRYLSHKPGSSAPVAVGSVRVTSDPRKAQVLLDGADVKEKTPMVISRVSAGKDHDLEIRLKYFETFEKKFRLKAGEESEIAAKLVPIVGTLSITTDPTGAELFVNGEAKGPTPAVLSDVPIYKSLEIEVRHEDCPTAKRTIGPSDWPADLALEAHFPMKK